MNKDISEYSARELKKALERKEREDKKIPAEKAEFHPSRLVETIRFAMRAIVDQGYSKDHEYYIYEEAMQMIYGDDIWAWMRENNEGC